MRGQIQAVLDGQLAALNLPHVAWQNMPFEPHRDWTWVKPTLLGGPAISPTIGLSVLIEERGVYQLDVYTPTGAARSAGMGAANVVITSLQLAFRPTLRLPFDPDGSVRVSLTNLAPAIVEPRWVRVPLSVNFVAYYFVT